MGLLRSLLMLVFLTWFYNLSVLEAQNLNKSSATMAARSLDALLQDYAYRAFVNPKTGIPYNGSVPSILSGINIAALRLRSGSLRRRGFAKYNEFRIPTGVLVTPYVERLVLVYQNLGSRSEEFYPLPGFTFIAPVLGLLAYDAANLSATNLPELNITASLDPISIGFSDMKSVPEGTEAMCVRFDLQGMVHFSNVVSRNNCSTTQQGHFSIVTNSVPPSPSPVSPSPVLPSPSRKTKKSGSKTWVIVGSVVGGVLLLILLIFLVLLLKKYLQKKRMQEMQRAGESGEALRTSVIGETIAPTAASMRTQPKLETEPAS